MSIRYLSGIDVDANTLFVDSANDRVGIGTDNPIAKLAVEGGAYFADDIYLRDGATESGDILVRIYDSSDDGIIDVYRNNSVVNRIHGNGISYFNAGDVGIGTTAPDEKLQVVGNIGVGAGTYNGGVYANSSTSSVDTNWGFDFLRTAGQADYSTRLKYYPSTGDSRKGGIWNSLSNTWVLYGDSNDTPNVIIPSGNVGIGETSPLVPLHISRDSASGENIALLLDNNDTTAGNEIGMLFRTMVGSTNTDFEIFGKANAANDMDLVFQSDGSVERVRFTGDGNVGIGTDSPAVKLDVVGNISASSTNPKYYVTRGDGTYVPILQLESSTDDIIIGATSIDAVRFVDDSGEAMRIDGTGNVGIGTTSPGAKLNVNTDALGVTVSDASGISLTNGTAAASGAQQMSPTLRWSGQGWKTNATAASQNVSFIAFLTPIQGSANPSGTLQFRSSINGGAYGAGMSLSTSGALTVSNSVTATSFVKTGGTATEYLMANGSVSTLTNPVTGTGTTNYVPKFTGAGTIGDSQIFDDGTNVGIGTANPLQLLDLRRDTNGPSVIRVRNANGGTGDYAGLQLANDLSTNGGGIIIFGSQTTYASPYNPDGTYIYSNRPGGISITSEAAAPVYIATNNSIRLYVASAGNVGIGTTNPSYPLHVVGNSELSGSNHYYGTQNANNGTTTLTLRNYDTTLVDAGDIQGRIQFTGRYWSGATSQLVESRIEHGHQESNGNGGSFLRFLTQTGGSGVAEQMRIDKVGNVGIGTDAPSQKLHVSGNLRVTGAYYDSNNEAGTSGQVLTSTGTGTDWKSLSEITGVDGTGTANYVAKWSDTDTIANSQIRDDGTTVGVGQAPGAAKFMVNGSVTGGGQTIYNKSYASLDTTGQAVAGLSASTNGQSAMFTFTCRGGAGEYQRIVYSCHNTSTIWNARKVVDEGTNVFDVVASASDTTITFTFKARTTSQGFTPAVLVEHFGGGINTSYL